MTPLSGILGILSGVAQSVAGWFGWVKQKDEQLNAPDIKKNVDAKNAVAESDKFTKDAEEALRTGNLTNVRKDDSEN